MTWPATSPTYGTYDWFALNIGQYLGIGFNPKAWDFETSQKIDLIIQRGLQEFYFPTEFGSKGERHKWSFLSPTATISTANGDQDYDLPTDFAGMIDGFTFPASNGAKILEQVDEATMRSLRSTEAASNGTPTQFAIRPKTSDGSAVQLWEALLYPTPSSTLTLTYRYNRKPPVIDSTNKYPHGGTSHVETVLASMLSVAEYLEKKEHGQCYQHFMARLAASVEIDSGMVRGATKPWTATDATYGTYQWLCRGVGNYLGYGINPNGWTTTQTQMVNDIVQSGARQFYRPPVEHLWSFLVVTANINMTAGDYDYDMPSDFTTEILNPTWQGNTDELRPKIVSSSHVRALQQTTTSQAVPKYVAIRPKAFAPTAVQAFEMIVSPTPNATYVLRYQYPASPAALSNTNLYPLGTNAHAETIFASCMAVAEARAGKKEEAYWAKQFEERLKCSIAIDKRAWAKGSAGEDE